MNKAFHFCGQAQRYYKARSSKTKVLPASLTSIEDVMVLAGADHITVAPPLLELLASTLAEGWRGCELGSVFKNEDAPSSGSADERNDEAKAGDLDRVVSNYSAWRLAFARSDGGHSEGKLSQAISIFADMQEKLEEIARRSDLQL